MAGGRWTVVETLGAQNTWSVLAIDGRPTEWKSIARSLPTSALPLVAVVHERGETVERRLPPSRQLKDGNCVRAIPIPGPDGVVHAVLIWVGDDFPTAAPPAVAGFSYSSTSRTLELSDDLYAQLDLPKVANRSRWTGPEAFRRVERFDSALELISMTIDPTPNDRWLGQLSLRAETGTRRLTLAFRNGDTPNDVAWRCLAIDVSETTPPDSVTVETAALAALSARNPSTYIALVDIAHTRLIRWVTDPVPGILWKGIADERESAHPDDVARVRATTRDALASGNTTARVTGLRLRRKGGGWTVVDATGSLLPHTGKAMLVLVEYTVVGSSDEPDPVPPHS
ncbi:GAF domain-containing protein [Antrihabitans cavernicola]|uniref:PAS domain-containing protein n=1 Tax=Antrihabitans cavernicola TaxID=2495913 RepID=A0A5A7S8H3_9NOCA|nr:GAF domain-containing protein [Spelaeibacter cavernicola]KAA0021499.1 PAS domain-containing protein [Spelaeibacter cavernicola]